jgi:DNA-directed RNA polymerase specialized sigma24 family protein
MARTYQWSPKVAAIIATLPMRDGQVSLRDPALWALIETHEATQLPLEVIAYLVRMAYVTADEQAIERLCVVLWDRAASRVAYYARAYSQRLQRSVTVEDVTVEVFEILCRRLRSAEGITFYEAIFVEGIKLLTLDKVRRLKDEPLESLAVQSPDGDEEEQRDLVDPEAIDPQAHAEQTEARGILSTELGARLRGLREPEYQTALLLMQGLSETAIAGRLGVTTRTITNHKAAIRRLLADFSP